MTHDVPAELAELLAASDAHARDATWARFVAANSRLLLHVARRAGGSHDAVMDRYAFILERLRADDCRRLRLWAAERRSKLTTWLVVVAQRLCLDEHRQRYGRPRGDDDSSMSGRAIRRRLADLLAEEVDVDYVRSATAPLVPDAEQKVRRAELLAILDRSLAELAPADRLMLMLRFRDGLSAAEIAWATGASSQFQVYRRLNRVLEQLRLALTGQGVEGPIP